MRFSLYTEMQPHEGKTPEQLYGEALEHIENADRLGYDCYASVEHFFFPKFSISTNPTAPFAAAAQGTQRIRFRTMLHALPYHNPTVLASAIAATDILTGGRYEWGGVAVTAGSPRRPGSPSTSTHGPATRRRSTCSSPRLQRALLVFPASTTRSRIAHRAVPAAEVPDLPRRTSDRTYELAAEHGWGVAVPPLLPYKALEQQLDLYRERCAEHGNEPDIVWIHACHLDPDRETALREARDWVTKFIYGNSSPLLEYEKPSADDLNKAGYGFYAAGSWSSSPTCRSSSSSRRTTSGWARSTTRRAHRGDAADLPGGQRDRDHGQRGRGAARMAIKNQELFASEVMPRVPDVVPVGAAKAA